ncbi:beta/gamma crystallin domain-containing protein [Kitasatospora sp. NPDC048365]|uniref:beta/gamma crystallin domain-containing protein n=1 Tax=Kitasatospora sp. NPDC048365 TaxID=3364050 RepID=UPI003723FAFB
MASVRRRAALVLAGAAALALALPTSDASAISRVNCNGRYDFVNVFNYNWSGRLCFANAGYTGVTIYSVDDVYSGNNEVWFYLDGGIGTHRLSPWTWQSDVYYDAGAKSTMRWIQIG